MVVINHRNFFRHLISTVFLLVWGWNGFAQTTKLNVDFRTPGTVYFPVPKPTGCAMWVAPESESDESQLFLQASDLRENCLATWEVMVPLGVEDKITVLEFNHLFDFPANQGGWVEVSYDGGVSWTNLVDDRFGQALTRFYSPEKVSYVIPPSFTGSSGRFWSTKFQWVWQDKRPESLHIRFVFNAPLPNGESPTWVIDDVWIFGVKF